MTTNAEIARELVIAAWAESAETVDEVVTTERRLAVTFNLQPFADHVEAALTAAENAKKRGRDEAWKEAIRIAKDYERDAGSRAFAIRDRYGDDGSNEADLEEAAQVTAENIANQLETAASQPVD